ncbi:hypothetical protein B6U90_06535 [Thermoplasmatales archaeon ex4484_6]|nr:MAG: hypothetical protein B6U90_06535 [Thermoplasmatales archaeon ex4484_6]
MAKKRTQDDKEVKTRKETVDRSGMVEFLVSGGLSRKLSEDLYEQGITDWNALIGMDEKMFLSLKGVGKKNAEKLAKLAAMKREELEALENLPDMEDVLLGIPGIGPGAVKKLKEAGFSTPSAIIEASLEEITTVEGIGEKSALKIKEAVSSAFPPERAGRGEDVPDLFELIGSIPRVTAAVIDELRNNGYDRYVKFKDLEPSKLQELKGIGPALSVSIIERVNQVRSELGIDDSGPGTEIEEAEGMEEKTEEKETGEEAPEGGFIKKLIDGIRNLFRGKKEEGEEKGAEEEMEEGKEEKKEETAPETPAEKEEETEEKVEEAAAEEEKEEKTPETEEEGEEAAPETAAEGEEENGEKVEEAAAEEEREEKAPEKEEDAGKEKIGFFRKIRNMFFKEGEEGKASEKEELKEEAAAPETAAEGEEGTGKKVEEAAAEEGKEEEAPKEGEAGEKEEAPPGTPPEDEGPLGLKGIESGIQQKLVEAGYRNLEELKEAVPEDLTMIEGIDEPTAKRICDALGK